MGWIRLCEPWQLRNQTELSESPILLWGKLYSLLCPSAQYTHPEPSGGLESDCPSGINWSIQKPFIAKAQEDLTMLFKPLYFAHAVYAPCSPDKLILTLQGWSPPWSSHNFQSPFSPLHLLDQRDCFFSTLTAGFGHFSVHVVLKLFCLCVYFSLYDLFTFESVYVT